MSHESELDKFGEQYWSRRYTDGATGWDIGYVSTPLKYYFDQLKNTQLRILLPGAGNSYEAEYLFRKGFKNVFVLDISSQPLSAFKQRVRDFPASQLVQADFFEWQPAQAFDLIIEQTFFCALHPGLRENYAEKMFDLIATNGKLAGVFFNDSLFKDQPPFGGTFKEYPQYFEQKFKKIVYEECYNSIAPRAGREIFFIFKKTIL